MATLTQAPTPLSLSKEEERRTPVLIPSGCSVVYTDFHFTEKKNLLRHNKLCGHNERASNLTTFKKRMIEDSEQFK